MIALLAGCATEPAAPTAVDLRLDPADYEVADGAALVGADVVIEPGQDAMWCVFETWEGGDVGIHATENYQAEYGHHVVLLGSSASPDQYPDGTIADCSSGGLPMTDFEPIVVAPPLDGENYALTLPDGMAAKFRDGQRYVLQSHYLNTGDEAIRVQDIITVHLIAEDEVEVWAAPFALNASSFSIPAGEGYTETLDCAVDETFDVLFLNGHMHEWGRSFRFSRDGEELYAIEEWDPLYRDFPLTVQFDPGQLRFAPGETLRTECTWFNDTDEALEFPHEMCTTAGMLYPSLTPVICDD